MDIKVDINIFVCISIYVYICIYVVGSHALTHDINITSAWEQCQMIISNLSLLIENRNKELSKIYKYFTLKTATVLNQWLFIRHLFS